MSYQERRVRVKNYGVLPGSCPLLVRIPGVGSRRVRLHVLAAAAFERMAAAVAEDLGLELKAASGWRRHRWNSREHYESTMEEKFGSVREGRKWVAYDSPHETGLAVDLGVGGLKPSRRTADEQRETPLHAWLVEHAHEHGWRPYKREPWHWEFPLSRLAWESGEFPADEAPEPDDEDLEDPDEDDVVEDEIDDDEDDEGD